MDRYYVTVTLGHRSFGRKRIDSINMRLRETWPLAALLAHSFAKSTGPGSKVRVVANFDGAAAAMFVLGIVMNAYELEGVSVEFHEVSIGVVRHEKPITAEELARP